MGLGEPSASTSSAMKPPANTAKGAFDGAPYRTDCLVSLFLFLGQCPVALCLMYNAILKVMSLQVETIFLGSISFVRVNVTRSSVATVRILPVYVPPKLPFI